MKMGRAKALAVIALVTASTVPVLAQDAQFSHWLRGLYGRPAVTRSEVLLGACVLLADRDWRADPSWAARTAHEKGLYGERDDRMDDPATRGFASRVFVRLLDIEGGLWMRLTGRNQRYAYRELVILGLMPAGGEGLRLSGDELAGLLIGSERYRREGPRPPPSRSDLR